MESEVLETLIAKTDKALENKAINSEALAYKFGNLPSTNMSTWADFITDSRDGYILCVNNTGNYCILTARLAGDSGMDRFMYNKSLKYVKMNNIGALPNNFFRESGFTRLNSSEDGVINFPEGMTSLGYYSCAFCSGIKIVNIPSSATNIGTGYYFNGCLNLEEVYIHSTKITSLSTGVFGGCTNLKILDFGPTPFSNIPTTTTSSIPNNTNLKIIVPDDNYEDWKAATNWVTLQDKIIKYSDYYGV